MIASKLLIIAMTCAVFLSCKPRQNSGLLDQPAPENFPHAVNLENKLFLTHNLMQDPQITQPIVDFEMHPDADILATVSASGEIGIWNAKEKKLIHKFQGPTEAGDAKSIATHPINVLNPFDDMVLAVGDINGGVHLTRWEQKVGELRKWFKMRGGHTGPVHDIKWYFPLDRKNKNEGEYFLGPLLVTNGEDGALRLNAWGYISNSVWTFGLDRRPVVHNIRRDKNPRGNIISNIIKEAIGTPLGQFQLMRDGSIAFFNDNVFEVSKPRFFGISPAIPETEFRQICSRKGGATEEVTYHNANFPELVCIKDGADIDVCYRSEDGRRCIHDQRSIEMWPIARKAYAREEVEGLPKRLCADVSDNKRQEMLQKGQKQYVTGLGHHRQQEDFQPQFCNQENSDVVFIALDDGTIHTYLHHYQAWLNPTGSTGGDFQKTSCFGDRYILDRDYVYSAFESLGCSVNIGTVAQGHMLTVGNDKGRVLLYNRATKHTEIEITVSNTGAANQFTSLYSENGFFIKPEGTSYFQYFDFDKSFTPRKITETKQVDSDVSESGRYVFGINEVQELNVFDTDGFLTETELAMQGGGEPLKEITSFRVLRDYNSCAYPRSGKDVRDPNAPIYLMAGHCSGEVAVYQFLPDGRTYGINKVGVITQAPTEKPDVGIKCSYGTPPLVELSEDFTTAVVGHWDRHVELFDIAGPFDPYNRDAPFSSRSKFRAGPVTGQLTQVEYYGITGDCGGDPKAVAIATAAQGAGDTAKINTRVYSIDPSTAQDTLREPVFEFDGPASDIQIWDRIYSMIVGFERPLSAEELTESKDPGNIQLWSLDPNVPNLPTQQDRCTTRDDKNFIVRRRLGENFDAFECNHRYIGHGAGTTAIGFAPYRGPEKASGGRPEGNRFVSAGGGLMRVWDAGRYRTQIWNLPVQMPPRNPRLNRKCGPYIEMIQMRPMAILGGEEALENLEKRIADFERANPDIKDVCASWQAKKAEGNLFYSIGRVDAIQQRGNLIYTAGEDGLLLWWGNNEIEPVVQ